VSSDGTQVEVIPRARGRGWAFAITWLAYASYYLGRKGFSVAKAAVSRELGVGIEVLASIDTAYLVAYAAGQVPSGVAADRFGPRRLVGFGLIGSAIACALFGVGQGALVLGACFALNGFAQSTGWPGTTKAMAGWTSAHERGRVMGLWSTCYQVGGVAATALATYLLAHSGWRAAFLWPAVWLAGMGVVVLIALRPAPAPARIVNDAIDDDAIDERGSPSLPLPTHALKVSALRNPTLYCYGACYFCIKLIRYSLLFWLPYYLHTAAGLDETQSGFLSTSFEIGGTVGSIGLGWLSDHAGNWASTRATGRNHRALVSAASLLGLAATLFVYARIEHASVAVHFACMAMVGALLFGPDALLSGAAAQDASGPEQAATATGLVNGMGSAGALLQGALTVGVQSAFGWNGLFYAFFVLALIACACLLPALLPTPRAADGKSADGRGVSRSSSAG
jgi:sugar phosphate permease